MTLQQVLASIRREYWEESRELLASADPTEWQVAVYALHLQTEAMRKELARMRDAPKAERRRHRVPPQLRLVRGG